MHKINCYVGKAFCESMSNAAKKKKKDFIKYTEEPK